MRTRVIGLIAGFVLASGALATPAVAADVGTIRGRVVNGRNDKAIVRTQVVLTQSSESGARPEILRTRTDGRGNFEFADLPTGDEILYTLTARFDGGYYGGAVRLPSDTSRRPVIETTLRVWPTIDDPAVIVLQRDAMFLSVSENGLDVIESVTVVNNSNRAYIGRGGSNDGPRSSLGFAVPDNAELPQFPLIDSTIDIPGPMPSDFGFAITAAIPPGESRFTFAYRIPGSAGNYTIARAALYPTLNTLVHAEPPLSLSSNRLVRNGSVTIDDTTYDLWTSTQTTESGDTLQISATAEADGIGLGLGIAAAAVLIVGLIAVAFFRARRPPLPRGTHTYGGHPVPETREHLLSLIAALDLRYNGGDITEEEWTTRRAELKRRLNELQAPEPTS
jgi:hypothetical protein